MRANPGGTIGAKDVIGRDELIRLLWEYLDNQSLVLTSERRIGKTCVIRKMKEEASDPNLLCVLRDLEGLRSPQEFVESVYHDVEEVLARGDRALLKFQQLFSKLGGAQIGDIKLPQITLHWKNLLSALMEDLLRSESRRVVFFWDELPLFVHNVKTGANEAAAMEFLDVLRSLRQRHNRLRMLFTGSVGLHQVIKSLRGKNYANDPTNDMMLVEVSPLQPADGARLAALLIDGEELTVLGDAPHLAQGLSEVAGHIPYYIHFLVFRLKTLGATIRAGAAEECLRSLISDPNDPAHFHYYRERLRTYYEAGEEAIAVAALDALAGATAPLAFGQLLNLVRHKMPAAQEESVHDILRLLLQDHYLVRRPDDGRYEFRYPIVYRWWKFNRG